MNEPPFTSPEVRLLGVPNTDPHQVFGGFWKIMYKKPCDLTRYMTYEQYRTTGFCPGFQSMRLDLIHGNFRGPTPPNATPGPPKTKALTLPKTNIGPENRPKPKRKLI